MSTDLRTFSLRGGKIRQADKISNKLNRAKQHLEYTCAYSSQLKNVLGTLTLPELHNLHVYCIVPVSYYITTAAGAAKLVADSDKWTVPCLMSIYNCIQDAVTTMSYFNPNVEKLKAAIEQNQNQPWYTWAKRVLQKTEEWGKNIGGLCNGAIVRIEELLGPEKLQQIQEDSMRADYILKESLNAV